MTPKRERIEWTDRWVTEADGHPAARLLLVGDSIARSYFPCVRDTLGARAACAYLATSRSVCDPAFERELALVLDEFVFAGVHFNNGLHGWDYDETTYGRRLRDVLALIQDRIGTGRLIWASSTPIRQAGALTAMDARTPRVIERNRIATECAAALDVPINDLFAVVRNHPEYHTEDGIHFNDLGRRALGQQIAEQVTRLLPGVPR